MKDLKHLFLNELIETAIRERLIDSCERRAGNVVIVQGATRLELTPVRAHAYLRGVIQSMSRWRLPASQRKATAAREGRLAPARHAEDVPDGKLLLDGFQQHLLGTWLRRYEAAGQPFSAAPTGLTLWVQYNTATTVN